jgi:diguanylate cyclase (GGDEF)-like protein
MKLRHGQDQPRQPIPTAHANHESARHHADHQIVDGGYWPRAIGLRVVISFTYLVMPVTGVISMSRMWWFLSCWSVFVYATVVFAIFLRCGVVRWLHRDLSPILDTFMVTLAIVAVAQPEFPIWLGYFLIIASLSVFHTTRYIVAFSLWCIAQLWVCNYVGIELARDGSSWQVLTGISFLMMFSALNGDVIATSNRKLRDLVMQASMTDPLTGLDNRRRFREILDAHGHVVERPLAVLMYDLDNFKALNEEQGHVYADGVLVGIAGELRGVFREADTIARYGGDELIVLAHVDSVRDAVKMAERSLARVIDNLAVTMSVGIGVYGITAGSLDAAVAEADAALGRAKRAGKARVAAAVAA